MPEMANAPTPLPPDRAPCSRLATMRLPMTTPPMIAVILMSLKDREIYENGFAINEPLLQMDVDTKKDEKKYSKIYHRELFE